MSTTEKLAKLSEIARTKTFTGQSNDRLVTAVVDGAGRLRSLTIAQLDRSRTSAALLARDVEEAVNTAIDVATAEVNIRTAKILGTTPAALARQEDELRTLATRALAEAHLEPDPDSTHSLAGGAGRVTCDSAGGLVGVELTDDVLHRMNEKTLAARLIAVITQAQHEG
jgi:DNA-binding protein YbaB